MRMSPSEAVMWAVEKDPALRSDFTNVTVLDALPSEARLRATVERAITAIPRLADRVVSPPLRIAAPEWRADPTFDVDYHIRRIAIPDPGSMRDFLDVAQITTAPPLDRSRPLWEFTLVEGLEGGRAALLQRLHHTITDGVGGMRLSLSLVDLEREPGPLAQDAVRTLADDADAQRRDDHAGDPIDRDSPLDVVREALSDRVAQTVELAQRGAGTAFRVVTEPRRLPGRVRDAGGLLASLRRQVLVTDRGHSELFATRSLARRYDTLALDLDPLHRGGKGPGCEPQRRLRHRRGAGARRVPS